MSANDANRPGKNEKLHFFDKPYNVEWVLRIFYVICAVLLVLDFFVHRHIYVDFEKVPVFYALYGFVACVVLVLIANKLRDVLMRDEDYYDEVNDQPGSDED